MPALAIPPPAHSLPPAAPPPGSLAGRTLAEYTQSLALDVRAWRGRDVLDVGGGASSFTAEACARRINAVAVDPAYGAAGGALAACLGLDWVRPVTSVSLTDPAPDCASAAQRFLADYTVHYVHGRYVSGALPRLPFFDATFDLVICAGLLFGGTARNDFDWHLAACRELVRVSADEVRVEPVSGSRSRPSPPLARLRRELQGVGIAAEIRSVASSVGTGTILVLKRNGP